MGSQKFIMGFLKSKLSQIVFNRFLLLAVFSLGISQIIVSGQATKKISVGTIEAGPGEKVSGIIEVPKGIDQGTIIPVTVINGSKPGPVLALIAGMHGTEYVLLYRCKGFYQ